MNNILEGLRMVCFETAGAGPTASKLMAEYGAEVILVEPLKGVDTRVNRSFDFYYLRKKSIALDLKTAQGMEVMQRLLESSDVFLSNYRMRAVKRLGLDYDTLHGKYPSLICAYLTGYGEQGPMKDAPGFDVTAYWGRAGLAKSLMEQNGTPIVMPFAVGDISAGTMLCGGILGALYHRERTGEALKVSISLQGTGIFQNEEQLFYEQCGYHYPQTRLKPRRAHCNSYQVKDGYFQFHTMRAETDMPKIMRIIGREDLIEDPRYKGHWNDDGEHAEEIRQVLDEGFKKLTLEETKRRFEEEDVAFGAILGPDEVLTDPQAVANHCFFRHHTLQGDDVVMAASPIKYGNVEPSSDAPAPRCGQHTAEIMREMGYSEESITAMEAEQVILCDRQKQ